MKKYIIVIALLMVVLTGCALSEVTPTDAVRSYLDRYKNNETVVVNELNEYLSTEDMNDDVRDNYRKVYLRQYSNMKYEIKDETINGDKAVVTVQVTVFDYFKANNDSDAYYAANESEFILENGDIDVSKFVAYKINKLTETTDTVTYTMDINLVKVDGDWEVQPLSMDDLNKLHGVYEY